ncbi:uncharacterized protein V1518DRAFT_410805 [Limtongia smithiae]|uniref:uncharacterized protein n=1 Tax=Limtongia smithiae TaxID=1125753 RepID=UPI0034CF5CD2
MSVVQEPAKKPKSSASSKKKLLMLRRRRSSAIQHDDEKTDESAGATSSDLSSPSIYASEEEDDDDEVVTPNQSDRVATAEQASSTDSSSIASPPDQPERPPVIVQGHLTLESQWDSRHGKSVPDYAGVSRPLFQDARLSGSPQYTSYGQDSHYGHDFRHTQDFRYNSDMHYPSRHAGQRYWNNERPQDPRRPGQSPLYGYQDHRHRERWNNESPNYHESSYHASRGAYRLLPRKADGFFERILFDGPLYVKLPGSVNSTIIRGYTCKVSMEPMKHKPLHKPIKLHLPYSRAKVLYPPKRETSEPLSEPLSETPADSEEPALIIPEIHETVSDPVLSKPEVVIPRPPSVPEQYDASRRQSSSRRPLASNGWSRQEPNSFNELDMKYRDVRLINAEQSPGPIAAERGQHDIETRYSSPEMQPAKIQVRFPGQVENAPAFIPEDIPEESDSAESARLLFEEPKGVTAPKVNLPPLSVYKVTRSKPMDIPVLPSPPVVSSPIGPQSDNGSVHGIHSYDHQPVGYVGIPTEYRLTPEVMHQPRPTKVLSLADIEPPIPMHSPVDGIMAQQAQSQPQYRYGFMQRPRGSSTGYHGSRHDRSDSMHQMPPSQYYFASQPMDKNMARNMVPRAYAQQGGMYSNGLEPIATGPAPYGGVPAMVMPGAQAMLPVAVPSPGPVNSMIAQETNGMVYFYDPSQYYQQYYSENTPTPPIPAQVVMPSPLPHAGQQVDGNMYYYPPVPAPPPQSQAQHQQAQPVSGQQQRAQPAYYR